MVVAVVATIDPLKISIQILERITVIIIPTKLIIIVIKTEIKTGTNSIPIRGNLLIIIVVKRKPWSTSFPMKLKKI